MNFFSIITYGYIIIAVILILLLYRDARSSKFFLGRHKIFSWCVIIILFFGIILAVRARFVEPYHLTVTNQPLNVDKLKQSIKIAFIADIQVGEHKKSAWVEKIVESVQNIGPDLIIYGGDLISNEGTATDESVFLEPLIKLSKKYPSYYVMGNHEYGIGSATRYESSYWTGDKSKEVINRMKKLNISLLKDDLSCPKRFKQTVCLYGIDEIWHQKPTFSNLPTSTDKTALIFITHNPDGILFWPEQKQKPDIVLSGHTHGGQIKLPFIGPLARPGVELGVDYYEGLNYYRGTPIFTSVGTGESGGPIRLFVPPEIAIIELRP